MAKAPHLSEVMDQAVIDSAVDWTAYQFRGYDGGKVKVHCASRAEAVAIGREILAENDRRPVLIYAIDAAGRQAVAETLRA